MNEEVARLYASIGVRIDAALRGLREFRTRLGQSQSGLKTLRDQSKITATALNLGITAGITALGTKALIAFGDAQQAMSVFQLVTHATAGEMDDAAKAIEAVAKDLSLPGITRADAAEALLRLGQAGLGASGSLLALRPALVLATAGEVSAKEAADLLANALNAWHLKAQDASSTADILAATMKNSGLSMNEVAQAVQNAGADFAAAGVPIDVFGTLLAEVGKAGFSGSVGATALRNVIQSLAAPTEEQNGLLKALGVQVYDSSGKMRPFRDLLGELHDGFARLTPAQQETWASTLFGKDAMGAALAIIKGGLPVYDDMHDKITTVGIAQEIAAAKTNGLKGATDGLAKALNTTATDAVAPFTEELTKLERAASRLLLGFGGLDAGTKNMVVSAAAATVAMAALSVVIAGVAAAIGVLGSPIVLLVAAIWGIYWAGYWTEKAILGLNDAFASLTGKRIDFAQILQGVPILREVMAIWKALQDLGLAPKVSVPAGVTNSPGSRDDWNQPGAAVGGSWSTQGVQTASAATVQFNGPVYGFADLKDVMVRMLDEAKREGRVS